MTLSAKPTRGLAALAAAGLATLLTGCLKVETDLTLAGDTVSGTLLAALAAEDVAPLGLRPEEVFAEQDAGLGAVAGVATEPYEQDGWVGTQYTLDDVAIDELNAVSEGDPDGLRIVRDQQAGSYEFQLVMDLRFVDELDPSDIDDPDVPDIDLAELREGFEINVAVTFPGQVTEHNGELSGTTVSWQPQPGERSQLRAVAEGGAAAGTGKPGGAGEQRAGGDQPGEPDPAASSGDGDRISAWWWLAAAFAVLAAGGGATTFFVGRRRNRGASPDVE